MIDKNNITLVLEELKRFTTNLETKISSDPCCRFKILQDLYSLITKYIPVTDINSEVAKLIGEHARFKMLKTLHSRFAIVCLYYCCKYHIDSAQLLYTLALVYYKLLVNKYIRYCDNAFFQAALSLQHKSSRLRQLGDPISVVREIATRVDERFKAKVQSTCDNPSAYITTLYELRTRVAQKVKRVAKRYYQAKSLKAQRVEVSGYADAIYNRIMIYGDVRQVSGCTHLYSKLSSLPQVPADLVRDSIFEVLTIFGPLPKVVTLRSVNRALNNDDLKATLNVMKYLSIETTPENVLCLIKTYYACLKEYDK